MGIKRIKRVDEIIKLMTKHPNLEEIEIENGEKGEGDHYRLRIKNKPKNQDQTLDEKTQSVLISSPIVGTVYLIKPGSNEPYISIGDKINDKTILCGIVAMKINNEISIKNYPECRTGDISGEYIVKEILVKNKQPVEYGEELFKLKPIK